MNWILIVLLVVAGFLLIRYGKSLLAAVGKLFKDSATSLATAFVVVVAAVLMVVLFQPQTLIGSSGVFGSAMKISKAEANLRAAALDPTDNPLKWDSAPAKGAADALASEYQLASAKNKAGVSAASAEAACYLPKGHDDRALWDRAGLDPCESSVPAGLQASTRAVAKTTGEIVENVGKELKSIEAIDNRLSKPFGQAPAGMDPRDKYIYDQPAGIIYLWALLPLTLVLAIAIWLVRR